MVDCVSRLKRHKNTNVTRSNLWLVMTFRWRLSNRQKFQLSTKPRQTCRPFVRVAVELFVVRTSLQANCWKWKSDGVNNTYQISESMGHVSTLTSDIQKCMPWQCWFPNKSSHYRKELALHEASDFQMVDNYMPKTVGQMLVEVSPGALGTLFWAKNSIKVIINRLFQANENIFLPIEQKTLLDCPAWHTHWMSKSIKLQNTNHPWWRRIHQNAWFLKKKTNW